MRSAAKGTVRTAKWRTLPDDCKIRASAQQHEPGRWISGLHEMSVIRCRATGQANGHSQLLPLSAMCSGSLA